LGLTNSGFCPGLLLSSCFRAAFGTASFPLEIAFGPTAIAAGGGAGALFSGSVSVKHRNA